MSENLKKCPSEVKIFFLEIGHIGYKKNSRILRWFQKSQLVLVTKCSQKKFKSDFLGFFNFNFFGEHFVTKASWDF